MITKSKQVALYARVSTKDKGQDVENQLAQLREFCERQGYVIHDEYMDDESGTGRNTLFGGDLGGTVSHYVRDEFKAREIAWPLTPAV